jgi:hypothetical protein
VDEAATAIRDEVARLRALGGTASNGVLQARNPESVPGNSLLARALSPLARRYFLAPARIPEFPQGSPPPGIRHGRAGRQAEGTAVFFELRIGDGIVKSARFSAYGCPHTLAVVAWLCEVLEGSRLDAGIPGSPADWARKFEVPVEKLGRLLIVEDAMRAAMHP